MKNIFLITLLSFLLTSCVSYDSEMIYLHPFPKIKNSAIGNGNKIAVLIADKRENKDFVGYKKVGNKNIPIESSRNLIDIVKYKIMLDLQKDDFSISSFNKADKILMINIIDFKYDARRGFVVGESNVKVLLEVQVRDIKSEVTFGTKHNLELEKKHFIMPSILDDQEIVNNALQESLDSILANDKLIELLKK